MSKKTGRNGNVCERFINVLWGQVAAEKLCFSAAFIFYSSMLLLGKKGFTVSKKEGGNV